MRFLLNLLLFTFLVSCKNPKIKTKTHDKVTKDYVSIPSSSIKDNFSYYKKEFKQILELHPEISLYPPLHPDLAYNKNYVGFEDETGKDEYFTIYANLLKEKNKGKNSKRLRKKLIDAFLKVNYVHALYKRGGSGFSHQKPRIAAYAEFNIYNYINRDTNLNKSKKFYKRKAKYIETFINNMEKGILKLVNMPEYAKKRMLKEIRTEISQLEKLIHSDFLLESVKDFEQKYYNYDNTDLLW